MARAAELARERRKRESCGASIPVQPNAGRVPRHCSRKCRLTNDPDYAEGERVAQRARTSRRVGRTVLPFRAAPPPPPRQMGLDEILSGTEKRLVRYAGRDREGARGRAEQRARSAGVRERPESTKDWIRRLKEASPCLDCGEMYPYYVMQFDHRPGEGKSFNVSDAKGYSRLSIENEIAKCDLVCANCHSIRTHGRQPTRLVRLRVCARCERTYPRGGYGAHSRDRHHLSVLASVRGKSA